MFSNHFNPDFRESCLHSISDTHLKEFFFFFLSLGEKTSQKIVGETNRWSRNRKNKLHHDEVQTDVKALVLKTGSRGMERSCLSKMMIGKYRKDHLMKQKEHGH